MDRMLGVRGVLGAAGLLVASGAWGQGVAGAYTLVELVPASGQPNSKAFGINDQNEVAGWSGLSDGFSPIFSLGTVWDASATPASLSLVFGASSSIAEDINNEGTVLLDLVGASEDKVVRLRDGIVLTLPDPGLSGFVVSAGTRLSEAGEVGGDASEPGMDGQLLVWERTPSGMAVRDVSSSFFQVFEGVMTPDGAYVAGGSAPTGGDGSPQRFDPRDGTVTDVGPGGDGSRVFDASSSGYVVGASDFLSEMIPGVFNTNFKAFVFKPDGAIVLPGAFGCVQGGFTPESCVSIASDTSLAIGVNESGTVVGQTLTIEGKDEFNLVVLDDSVAFIWTEDSGLVDPTTLIVDGSADGWELDEATDINNDGWIVGNGINPMGEERAFLLKPTLPCAADVNRDRVVNSSDFFAWVTAFTGSGCD